MPLFPLPVEQFGGLNLLDAPDEVGFSGAIDLCDIDLDHPGTLRSRDKFSQSATTTLTSPSVVGCGITGYLVSTAAAVKLYSGSSLVGTAVAPNQYFNGSVQVFGTPTTTYIYMADSALANAIRRLTTAGAISAPAGMPTCRFLSRTPTDNRLVAGYIAGNPHRVQFSNAGDAETWGANNYVDLDPGDGEQITGLVVYHDLLFVFKQSKFFVFYGTSTGSLGQPEFNYRAVRSNVGGATAVAADDGVYFYGIGPRGVSVYRTTGSDAAEVGHPIRPVLNGLAPAYFTPGSLTTVLDMTFAHGRVRLLASSGANAYTLSYNPENSGWTIEQLPNGTTSISGYNPGNNFYLVAGTGANAPIHVLDPANVSTDSLRTPTPYYQSGFDNIAPPRRFAAHYLFGNTRKRLRKWKVTGSGTVTFGVAHDFGSVGTTSNLTLGTSPAIADKWHNIAARGQLFSYRLSSTSAWSVQKLTAYLAGSEPPLLGDPGDK